MFEIYVIGIIGAACIVWTACLNYGFWEDEGMEEELTKEKLIEMFEPDWGKKCFVCESDMEPVVPMSGLCGPCHFGTAGALGGDWWHDTKQELKEGF